MNLKKRKRIRYDRIIIFVIISIIFCFVLIKLGKFAFEKMNQLKDSELPTIKIDQKTYYLFEGSSFTLDDLQYSVSDDFDKDIASKVEMDYVDTTKLGKGSTTLSVMDQTGKKAKVELQYEVLPLNKERESLKEELITIHQQCDAIDILINKINYIHEDYEPMDLKTIDIQGHTLRNEAADAYLKMVEQAQKDGIYFYVISATRTKEYQQEVYDNYLKTDPDNVFMNHALPRTSEHELGLAIDISDTPSLNANLQDNEVGKWLNDHAHEYGFVLRYPKDKEDGCGYEYQAWHYRYVGVELAQILVENEIILEEYYQDFKKAS